MKTIHVKVCEKGEGTDPGSRRGIQAVLEDGNGKTCTTDKMEGPFYNGNFRSFSSLGNSCSDFVIGQEVKMWIVNTEDDDGLCLNDIYFDSSDVTTGETKSYRCRFDDSQGMTTYFQDKEVNGLPLICK